MLHAERNSEQSASDAWTHLDYWPGRAWRRFIIAVLLILLGLFVLFVMPMFLGVPGFVLFGAPAVIVWAVGALRNHPIRSARDIMVFASVAVLVLVLLKLQRLGALVLLTGVGIGMIRSALLAPKHALNPYRTPAARIFMAVAGAHLIVHTLRSWF